MTKTTPAKRTTLKPPTLLNNGTRKKEETDPTVIPIKVRIPDFITVINLPIYYCKTMLNARPKTEPKVIAQPLKILMTVLLTPPATAGVNWLLFCVFLQKRRQFTEVRLTGLV